MITSFSFPEDTLFFLPRAQGTKLAFAMVTRNEGSCSLSVAVRENRGEHFGHLLPYLQREVSALISTTALSGISFHQKVQGPSFHWENGILSTGHPDSRLGHVDQMGFMHPVPKSAVWGSGAGHPLGLLSLLLLMRRK
jgi:hypothetical protein